MVIDYNSLLINGTNPTDCFFYFNCRKQSPGHEISNYEKFIDLVSKMLKCDPQDRIKPMKALQHPFFTAELNWCDIPSASSAEGTPTSGKKRKHGSIIGFGSTKSPKKYRKPRSNALVESKSH